MREGNVKSCGCQNRVAKFWQRIDRRTATGCWEWTGARHPFGYGRVSWNGALTNATHVALYLCGHGWPLKGKVVRHKCDNPPCVNPDHLELGTQGDNIRDTVIRGRFTPAKLTEGQARFTYWMRGHVSSSDLAERFGVDKSTINNIWRRRTWRWIHAPVSAVDMTA
jgi:hypothetical protein